MCISRHAILFLPGDEEGQEQEMPMQCFVRLQMQAMLGSLLPRPRQWHAQVPPLRNQHMPQVVGQELEGIVQEEKACLSLLTLYCRPAAWTQNIGNKINILRVDAQSGLFF